MRLMTKAEACREMAVSLSTLDRGIASGEIEVRREQRGGRHRVYVVLDDDPPDNGVDAEPWVAPLDVAQERVRCLEEQAELLQTQLDLERERNAGLEEGYRQERAGRERMRRAVFILGLAVAGLVGMLVAGVLAAWLPLA